MRCKRLLGLASALAILVAIACNSDGPAPSPTTPGTVPPESAIGLGDLLDSTATPIPAASTPTRRPAATPIQVLGDVKLELVARSGQRAPGSGGEVFGSFAPPVISSGSNGTIIGIVAQPVAAAGGTLTALQGAWVFEPGLLEGGSLEAVVIPEESVGDGSSGLSWVGALDGEMVSLTGGSVTWRARVKREDGTFVDGIFERIESGGVAPSAIDLENKLQFDAFVRTGTDSIFYRSGQTIRFVESGFTGQQVLEDGDALEDLPEGWFVNSGPDITLIGADNRNTLVFMIENAIRTALDGTEAVVRDGVWITEVNKHAPERVAISGLEIKASQATLLTVRDVSYSGANAKTVAYVGDAQSASDASAAGQLGVWKFNFDQVETIEIARVGDQVNAPLDGVDQSLTIDSIETAVVGADGRVVFSASAFTDTLDFISLLIREGESGELEVLARTDRLPESNWLKTFGPLQVTELAVNRSGGSAFVLGFGEGLWNVSPSGQVIRVIEKFDTLTVDGEEKTVEFIDFVGGANTTSGRGSGLADDGDLAFSVNFADGTSAVYYALFPAGE